MCSVSFSGDDIIKATNNSPGYRCYTLTLLLDRRGGTEWCARLLVCLFFVPEVRIGKLPLLEVHNHCSTLIENAEYIMVLVILLPLLVERF